MADIVFQNTALAVNPGLEDVLDPNGVIGTHTDTEFEIVNTSGGAFNGFRFVLYSETATFTYSGAVPTGGTISSISVLTPDGLVHVVDVTPGADGFGNNHLLDSFYTNLHDTGGDEPGTFLALDELLSHNNSIIGSGVADHLTTFGDSFPAGSLIGAGGNDVLWARNINGYSEELAVTGGAGNDTIRIYGDAYGATIHGAFANAGTGALGEVNTLELVADENNRGQLEQPASITVLGVRCLPCCLFADRLTFLAPDIVATILEGRHPSELTLRTLLDDTRLPLDWSEQRASLGFA